MDWRAIVLARPELDQLRAERHIDLIAASINADPPKVFQKTFITVRAILTRCPNGAQIMAAFEKVEALDINVKYALVFLRQDSGLDIGDPETHKLLEAMVPALLETAWVDELKNLALKPVYTNQVEIAQALYYDDGTEKTDDSSK